MDSLKPTGPANRPSVEFYMEGVQARVYGDTVVLIGRVVAEYQRDGKTIGKEQQRYTDTYVKRRGRWQVVASHLSNDAAGNKPN